MQYVYQTATVEEASKMAPALVLDRVIARLAPEGYKQDRMVFQFQEAYTNASAIISQTPKSTLQALMMVMAYSAYAPFVAGSLVRFPPLIL